MLDFEPQLQLSLDVGAMRMSSGQAPTESGGCNDIVVTGDRDRFSLTDPLVGLGGGCGSGGDWLTAGFGVADWIIELFSPITDGLVEPPPIPFSEQAVDEMARLIRDEIVNMPDDNRLEYGAIIYRDAQGNLHRTDLVRGEDDRAQLPPPPPGSTIVGIVHNHPEGFLSRDENLANRLPSWNGSDPSDWRTADRLVENGRADGDHLSLYIIDYRSEMREYDYAEGRPVRPSDPM